jgi:hypothetical protein
MRGGAALSRRLGVRLGADGLRVFHDEGGDRGGANLFRFTSGLVVNFGG